MLSIDKYKKIIILIMIIVLIFIFSFIKLKYLSENKVKIIISKYMKVNVENIFFDNINLEYKKISVEEVKK